MNRIVKCLLQIVLLVPLCLPLTACALSGKAIEGQVLEEGTNKPVPDAIVIARWSGTAFSFVESPTVCLHVLMTTTDAEGKYRFPAWRKESPLKGVRDVRSIITAYKSGYETYSPPGYGRTEEYRKNIRYLKPFAGGREERLEYLLRVLGTTSCGAQDESEKNLIPLRKVLYEEAHRVAKTNEDQKTVEAILYRLEILELGFEEAGKRHLERVQGK